MNAKRFLIFLILLMTGSFLLAVSYDLVINNGRVVNPKNGYNQVANIGISAAIIQVVTQAKIKGKKVINAAGLIVSPGFIDILADNSFSPRSTYLTVEKYKIFDGVTTILFMHGGTAKTKETYEYFQMVRHLVNFGYSTKVMNIRKSTTKLAERLAMVQNNLDAGSLGVSHSIEYQPTPYQELLKYAKLAKRNEVPLFLHLRYSSQKDELKGVKEAISLARDSGAKVHLDHLNSTGGTFNMLQALALIDDARAKKLDITVCTYPYDYWATYISSKRFDQGWQFRYNLDYNDLVIVGKGERLTKESFYTYRKQHGILVAPAKPVMSLAQTFFLPIEKQYACVASDGGIENDPIANNHPRGAGCFSRAISLMRDKGYSLDFIISKLTVIPASIIRSPDLAKRASLEPGFVADITIFNLDKVKDKATITNPNLFSQGIKYVIVNGEIAVDNTEIKGYYGQPIKRDTKQ
ncbi:MAG: amidohydrolase family protein [bacterium]|nr:amidohydrolase family protein [bacterium]